MDSIVILSLFTDAHQLRHCVVIPLIVASFWYILYAAICNTHKNQSSEWSCRIISLIHAVIITDIIGIYFLTYNWPFDHLGERNTEMQRIILTISAGYFWFDTAWCLYMKTETPLMILHHSVSLVFLLYSLCVDRSGAETISVVWGSEITNPFLQVRWFLKKTGNYNTMFAKLNDLIFIGLFALVRILIGGYLALETFYSANTPNFVKAGGCVFYTIGVIWLCQILHFARKRFGLK